MLFKNAHLYRITSPEFDISEGVLSEQSFVPCSGIRPSSFGWVSPLLDPEGPLSHEVAGSLLLAAKREDKIVPTSALADVMAEKMDRLESMEGRKLRAKEKQRLKDDAKAELLPRALPRSKIVRGFITPADRLLVIDTASSTEAELFINCLRDSLGSFSVVPPQVKSKPADVFTNWLNSRKLPDNFSLADSCDLLDPETGSTVTCRKQDLNTREVQAHLDAGKQCSRIGLHWYGDLKFTLDKDLILRQIKLETSDDDKLEDEDPIASLDAAFVNMTLEFARFLPALFSALGGEHVESD